MRIPHVPGSRAHHGQLDLKAGDKRLPAWLTGVSDNRARIREQSSCRLWMPRHLVSGADELPTVTVSILKQSFPAYHIEKDNQFDVDYDDLEEPKKKRRK